MVILLLIESQKCDMGIPRRSINGVLLEPGRSVMQHSQRVLAVPVAPVDTNRISVVGRLPAPIRKGVYDADILKFNGRLDWLEDRRIVEALLYAHEAHDGQPRKRNPNKDRVIHEIWVGHRTYNDSRVRKWLAARGLDRNLGAFGSIVHDAIENRRALAEAAGVPFNQEAVLAKLKKIWGDPKSFRVIREEVLDYMTDQPGLHKNARLNAQWRKNYTEDGIFCASVLQQAIRMYDKLSHVVMDAQECRSGNLTLVKKAYRQADAKSRVLTFPIAASIRQEYRAAQAVLWKALPIKDRISFMPGAQTVRVLSKAFADAGKSLMAPRPAARGYRHLRRAVSYARTIIL